MAISMTKLSSADYYLDRTREALQADGAIPDEATPGPLTGPDPAAYYNAEGNPPGRWIGSASRLLGGETGRQAGAETVRMLINERRNPETGRSLDQAGIRADNDGQPPIAGYDLTQTVPKSVSILWAFADQDTRRAIDECLHQAADMTIGYFEAEYAATRAGAGGVASTACDGVAGFAFDHWDSRDGDPHPHTHLVISNRVRRTTDGQWTALDGRAVYGATVELSEYNANLVKDLLTQRLGWAWHEPARARGRGTRAVAGEVQGVPEELIDAFSGRDREIETRLAAIIDEEERRTGHTIGWKRRAELHKQVWLETRKPKTDARPGLAELTRRWHGKLRDEAPGTSIDAMWQAVDSHRDRAIELGQTASRAAGIRLAGQLADHQTPGRTELERLADAAMAHTERTRATWTLSNIRAEAERLLADIRLDPTARADTANQVAELAIRRCVKITPTRYRAGQAGDDPALVSRAGRSTFDDPHTRPIHQPDDPRHGKTRHGHVRPGRPSRLGTRGGHPAHPVHAGRRKPAERRPGEGRRIPAREPARGQRAHRPRRHRKDDHHARRRPSMGDPAREGIRARPDPVRPGQGRARRQHRHQRDHHRQAP